MSRPRQSTLILEVLRGQIAQRRLRRTDIKESPEVSGRQDQQTAIGRLPDIGGSG